MPHAVSSRDIVVVHSSDLHIDHDYTARLHGGDGTAGLSGVLTAARGAGVIGGKIVGAGGGGFFLVYCQAGTQTAVRRVFAERNMREITYRVDAGGTQVLVNHPRDLNTI